jgi:hypothetical protein
MKILPMGSKLAFIFIHRGQNALEDRSGVCKDSNQHVFQFSKCDDRRTWTMLLIMLDSKFLTSYHLFLSTPALECLDPNSVKPLDIWNPNSLALEIAGYKQCR